MASNSVARAERAALADLMLEVGPDAPTLCGTWTTRDLAAHLVLRERRPEAAGLVLPALRGRMETVQDGIAARPYAEVVAEVRQGPPFWNPLNLGPVDAQANTVGVLRPPRGRAPRRPGVGGAHPRRGDDGRALEGRAHHAPRDRAALAGRHRGRALRRSGCRHLDDPQGRHAVGDPGGAGRRDRAGGLRTCHRGARDRGRPGRGRGLPLVPALSRAQRTGWPSSRSAALTSPMVQLAEVEDARGEHGIRAGPTAGAKSPSRPGAAAAITGTVTSAARARDQLEVEAVLGAVGVHRVEQDLAGAELAGRARTTRPRRCRCACDRRGWSPRTRRSGARRRRAVGARRPRARAPGRRSGRRSRRSAPGRAIAAVFTPTLSAPARSSRSTSSTVRTPPPTVSGMKTSSAVRAHDVVHRGAVAAARGDVEEGQLVGALRVVARGRARPGRPRRAGSRS